MLNWLPWKSKQEIGAEAKALLENPVLDAAFKNVEGTLVSEWQNTKLVSTEDRERLYLMLQLTRQVKSELHKAVIDGEMEMRRQAHKNESK